MYVAHRTLVTIVVTYHILVTILDIMDPHVFQSAVVPIEVMYIYQVREAILTGVPTVIVVVLNLNDDFMVMSIYHTGLPTDLVVRSVLTQLLFYTLV